MTQFVLDNSITMRWAFDGGAHPRADAFLRDLSSSVNKAIVPILWRYEVSAVLSHAQNKWKLPVREVVIFLNDLKALPITVDNESSRRIFSDVHQLALTHRLTSYDAAYLELAIRRGLPIATLDNELTAASRTAGVKVL